MSSDEEFNSDDVEKIFTEIVSSDQLKDISENFERESVLGIKELLLLQQSLSESISNVSEMLIELIEKTDSSITEDETCSELLGSLYKIAEDLNSYVLEYYSDGSIIFLLEEDDDDYEEEDEESDDENGSEI
jgi:hypothetical protein